jgi:hypothetical protein
MKKCLKVLLISLLFSFLSPFAASSFDGPLKIKNQFPLFLHINSPYLEKASIENSLSVSLSYSSVFVVRNSARWSVQLDMEIAELNFSYRKNIRNFIELGIEIPVLNFNSGFMDNFLDSYHETFGFPDHGRSNRPSNEFLYEVRRDGNLIIRGRNGKTGIGDIRLTVKKEVLQYDPAISLKADIEFPTGKVSEGFGNGSLDAGIAIIIEKELTNKLKVYLNIGAVSPGNIKAHDTVKLKEFVFAGTAFEADILENFSLLGQLYIQSPPFPDAYISAIDSIPVLLTLGGRYYSSNSSFEFSFTEDPNTAGAPDFTTGISYKRNF